MDTQQLLKELSQHPRPTDSANPSFGLVVPHSVFTVPEGWEFVLRQPFEGVSYIAAVLYNAGYPVKIIDTRFVANPVQHAMDNLSDVDIVGIATYEDSFPFLEDITQAIKSAYPEKLIILGGSLVTSAPRVVMENTRADLAVLGEGELTILELIEGPKNVGETFRFPSLWKSEDIIYKYNTLNKINGICYKDKNNKLVFTAPRSQMTDLDSLPVMNLSLWPNVQKNYKVKEILTSASRGCYMNCSFCYRTTPVLSLKSPAKFREELKILKQKHDFEFLYLVDLTFALPDLPDRRAGRQRTIELCQVLKDFHCRWSCMTRVQNLDPELLRHMKEAGCEIILYGFESLDAAVLKNIRKGQSELDIRSAIRQTHEVGIKVGGLFIVGLPAETRESLDKVMRFTEEMGSVVRVKYLSALPGTDIYQEGLKKGLIKSEIEHLRWLAKERCQSDDEFINFTNLPDNVLREAYRQLNNRYVKGPRWVSC